MSTSSAGIRCEAAVLNELVAAGFRVLVPFGDGHPYDLAVDLGTRFLRVQCKTARPIDGCLIFNAYATDHGHGPVSYVGRADVFGVYFPPSHSVYLVPVGLIESECRLRLQPPRNNQRRRVRFASDFEFSAARPDTVARLAALHIEVGASGDR
jgi:hypothetical protein